MTTRQDYGARRQAANSKRKRRVLIGMAAALVGVIGLRLAASVGPKTALADAARNAPATTDTATRNTRVVRPYEPDWPITLEREVFALPGGGGEPALPTLPTINPEAVRLEAARLIHVQAIIQGERRAALINNQRFEEGDVVAGFVILHVRPDGVELLRDTVRVWIGL